MNGPDEELRAQLRQWEAPQPGPGMDARVRSAWHDSRRHSVRNRRWLAIAAGVLLIAGAMHLMQGGGPRKPRRGETVRVMTTADAAGFVPLDDVQVTVVRMDTKKEKR